MEKHPITSVVVLGNVAGNVALDASMGNVFDVTLTANVTFAVKNVKPGDPFYVRINQDGVGGHTANWNGVNGQTIIATAGDLSFPLAPSTTTTLAFVGSATDMSKVDFVGRGPSGIGRFIQSTVVTVSQTFALTTQTNSVRIRVIGGGGGGGGCNSGAAQAGVGGGGSAGSYNEGQFSSFPLAGVICTIGAGGTGGLAGFGGGNGGVTSAAVPITPGGPTLTVSASPGLGGTSTNNLAGGGTAAGGNPSNGPANGLLPNNSSASGLPGFLSANTPVGISGKGGDSPLAGGGAALVAAGAGNAALKFGAGGGGAMVGASSAQAGGAGAAGVIIIDEYS